VNVAVKAPVESVVAVATGFASKVTVIPSIAPNPVPLSVTGVVCGPNAGESVIAAVPDACAAILTEMSKPRPSSLSERNPFPPTLMVYS
jgi:hypothetical protein